MRATIFAMAAIAALGAPAAATATTVSPAQAPMPEGRLFDTVISLEHTRGEGLKKTFKVTVRGDGLVIYTGDDNASVHGQHSYRISPGEVAALIERLRSGGLWSMADRQSGYGDETRYILRMTTGGRTKIVIDDDGPLFPVTGEISGLEDDILRTARADSLVTLGLDGLKQLDAEGFDYKTKAGADLLMRVIQDDGFNGSRRKQGNGVSDEVIMRLLDRGTPLTGGWGLYPLDSPDGGTAIEAALDQRRQGVVERLIDMGALKKDGKLHQQWVDRAFRHAIGSARLKPVTQLAAYHPALTFTDTFTSAAPAVEAQAPVTLFLNRDDGRNPDRETFTVARFLVGLGCDINGRGADGGTLLFIAAMSGDPEFVRWLLDKGAEVNVVDRNFMTPLMASSSEAVALMLLEAGADPMLPADSDFNVFQSVQEAEWTRVIAWLEAHGYAEQLKAHATKEGK